MKKYKFNHVNEDLFPKKKLNEEDMQEPELAEEHDPENKDKSYDAIKALIDMKEIDTEDEQGKFLQLIRGLIFADNTVADKFLKAVNDFTSTLKLEDFK